MLKPPLNVYLHAVCLHEKTTTLVDYCTIHSINHVMHVFRLAKRTGGQNLRGSLILVLTTRKPPILILLVIPIRITHPVMSVMFQVAVVAAEEIILIEWNVRDIEVTVEEEMDHYHHHHHHLLIGVVVAAIVGIAL